MRGEIKRFLDALISSGSLWVGGGNDVPFIWSQVSTFLKNENKLQWEERPIESWFVNFDGGTLGWVPYNCLIIRMEDVKKNIFLLSAHVDMSLRHSVAPFIWEKRGD